MDGSSNGKVTRSGDEYVSVCVLVPFGSAGSGVDDDSVVHSESAGDQSVRVRSECDWAGSSGYDVEVLADGWLTYQL